MNRTIAGEQDGPVATMEESAVAVDWPALNDESAAAVMEPDELAAEKGPSWFRMWMGWSREESRPGEPGASRNRFSQAIAWIAEPEWVAESSETECETAAGSREPEGYPG